MAYPLDPVKMTKVPLDLIADIEIGLSGRRAGEDSSGTQFPSIPWIRRSWTCGTWYDRFPRKRHYAHCNECLLDEGVLNGLTRDNSLDYIHGPGYRRGWFSSHKFSAEHQADYLRSLKENNGALARQELPSPSGGVRA
jgi:hypothetical protein